MKLSVCPQPYYDLSVDAALDAIAEAGFTALEVPLDAKSPFATLDAGSLRRLLDARGLAISAVSNHQEGQLLLGPHHADTDAIHAGDASEKIAFATDRLTVTAERAADLGVSVVVGFLGCEDYTRFFPWPDADGWEKMAAVFQDRVGALLDRFDRLGVSFAQEPHPKQFVYNTETAIESVRLLDGHRRWGFNLDPANLLLAGVDPVVFARDLAARVLHVHAKDGEIVAHNVARSGLLAHGPWDRKDRGFRFRVPGWGDVPWKRLVSELQLAGYGGYLAIENEDPIFNPHDGLRKAVDFLAPLLPVGERAPRWW